MKNILLIDDEELIVKTLSKLLEKEGYDVIIIKNSKDAVVIVEEIHFDLIISDIRMPGFSGTECIAEIKKKLKTKCPPVIFITGFADSKLKEEATKLNPIAYIKKPFDIPELTDRIKTIFS